MATPPNHQTVTWPVVGLVFVIAAALLVAWWQPWTYFGAQNTITISGANTVATAPDQFTFSPVYQKDAPVSSDAISQVSAIGNEVVAKLKALGVADTDITTNVASYQNYAGPIPVQPSDAKTFTANFRLTATVNNADLAKNVLAYLATTPVAGGSVTPSAGFSKERKAELEKQTRAAALADARDKADQTAKALGVKILGVKSVSETSPFSPPIVYGMMAVDKAAVAPSAAPTFSEANQDYTFTVTVEYRIR